MALENILQSIEERRNSELDRISREYEGRMSSLASDSAARLEALKAEFARRTAEDCKSLENRELSNADIEAKRMLRERKSQLIEVSLGSAYKIMDDLNSSSAYASIVEEMVDAAKRILGKEFRIRVGQAGASLIKETKGRKVSVEDVDPHGGLIAESPDGTMELDFTVATLKRELKDRIMLEIAERFGAK